MHNINHPDSICLWCGKSTAKNNTHREHMFPETIGGKTKLPAKFVCKKCNQNLGFLDEALKKEHPFMMDAFQVDEGIIGKIRGKNDRMRKKKEKINIQGKFEASSTSMRRDNNNENVNFVNADFIITSKYFVRSLHKCIANILCYSYGPAYVRKSYPELLYFVKNGRDVRPWTYAVSYAQPFDRLLISEPKVINHLLIKIQGNNHEVISFIHTSGIWIVGSSPYLLNPNLIEKISDEIVTKLAARKNPLLNKPLTDFFGFEWDKEKRICFGKLKFLWCVKEIEGKPNDDSLYLLTKCRMCGQTNPTGIILGRKILYEGDINSKIMYSKNSWNKYTENDLKKMGLKTEKLSKESLKTHTAQGISIPVENDVKKMNIKNCKTNCINCNSLIEFSADDCFI